MELADIRAFARIADLGSVSAAARSLDLPKSTISRSLARLEVAVGAMLVDRLSDGLSAVYSFFDPTAYRRSLGTFIVLAATNMLRRQQSPFLYLGYWIALSRKMSYKSAFRPLQALGPAGWVSVEPGL